MIGLFDITIRRGRATALSGGVRVGRMSAPGEGDLFH